MAVRSFVANATGAVGPQFPRVVNAGGLDAPGGNVKLLGWQFNETAGVTNLTVTITDGGVSTGKVIAEIVVQKGTAQPAAWFGPEGIDISVGCYVTISGGTAAGNLFVR